MRIKKPESDWNILSIAAAGVASITSAFTGNYVAAGWATFTAIVVYRLDLQRQKTKEWQEIQLRFDEFLNKEELEEIKNLLKRLDSWEEME